MIDRYERLVYAAEWCDYLVTQAEWVVDMGIGELILVCLWVYASACIHSSTATEELSVASVVVAIIFSAYMLIV